MPSDLVIPDVNNYGIPAFSPLPTFQEEMILTAFVSPECSYPVLRDALRHAREEILVYMYHIHARHMISLLQEAAARRRLRVRVMLDRRPHRFRHDTVFEDLTRAGVEVQWAPMQHPRRAFNFCHQKFMVVDRYQSMLSSGNWSNNGVPFNASLPPHQAVPYIDFAPGNREWGILIQNPALAEYFADLFEHDWELEPPSRRGIEEEEGEPEGGPQLVPLVELEPVTPAFPHTFDRRPFTIQPLLSFENYFPEVMDLFDGARQSIRIQQQYISRGNHREQYIQQLLDKLVEVRRRRAGVRIQLVIEGHQYTEERYRDELELLYAAGFQRNVRFRQGNGVAWMHNKGILIDGKVAVVCSQNWSDNSLISNRETGLAIRDAEVAGYFRNVFDRDWNHAEPAPDLDSQEFATRFAPPPASRALDGAPPPGYQWLAPEDAVDYERV